MKLSAEHTAHQEHAPADLEAVDMHAPIYDGKWGYITEAEKQALITSLDQADHDYEHGKAIRADDTYWEARQKRLKEDAKARGLIK